MSQIGRSGKTAVGAFFAALGMLVLTAITLEEAVLFTFLGLLAVGYVASVAEAFARRRHLALLVGAAGTSLFIGCGMAFLRMWGLGFTEGPSSLSGPVVSTTDPDVYFYLAVAAGTATLLVLFAAATWPGRRRSARPLGASARQRHGAPPSAARSSARSSAARRPTPQRQTGQGQPPQRPTGQRPPAQRPQRPQRKTL